MNPIVVILVAGKFQVSVEICHALNEIGEECRAKVSDMAEHLRWHSHRGIARVVRYCAAGAHEYLKSAAAPSTLSCQAHTHHRKQGQEKGKRMLSTGCEKPEGIRAA